MALSLYTSALLTTFITTSLSTVVVALRFYARYFLVGKLNRADWVMLAALLSTWFTSVSNYFMIHYLQRAESSRIYDRKHTWPKDITGYLMWIWIFRINYIVSLCLIKTSILLFYNFVASSRKSFYRIVRGMIAIVIIVSFAMIMASVFSCNPPSDAWSFKVWIRQFRGVFAKQCYNPANLWLFSAGFNLVTDTFIWILPIPFILHLRTMNTRRRLELLGIFSIGLVALVASAMRLRTMISWLTDYKRQTVNSVNLVMWSQAEQHAGIISASIPFLRPIIRRAFNATIRSRDQHSPGPAKRLIPPVAARTPIIPSPSPTLESRSSLSRPPPSPLAPISPITPIPIGTAL